MEELPGDPNETHSTPSMEDLMREEFNENPYNGKF